MVSVFFFRVAHGGLFVIFLTTYFYFTLKGNKQKGLLLLGVFLGFMVFLSAGGMQYVEILSRTSEFYMEQASKNSSASSLGNIFYSSNNPVFLVMRPIMLLFSPLPPPVLVQMRLDSLFFSIGSLVWYYLNGLNILALFSPSIKKKGQNSSPLLKALFVTVIISLILVSFTSRDPRHLVYFYPFVLVHGIHNYLSHKNLRKSFPLLAIVAFLGLVSLYILLKAFT
ncbi:hypothetical protein J4E76_14865 [Fabibacter sp. E12]|nr:hypothetical protein [Roseivirga sp. E12]